MFQLNAGYFLIQCASEDDREAVYRMCGEYSREDANGVPQVCFMGVINPLDPRSRPPSTCATSWSWRPSTSRSSGWARPTTAASRRSARRQAQARLAGLRARHRDAEDRRAARGRRARAPGAGRGDGLERPGGSAGRLQGARPCRRLVLDRGAGRGHRPPLGAEPVAALAVGLARGLVAGEVVERVTGVGHAERAVGALARAEQVGLDAVAGGGLAVGGQRRPRLGARAVAGALGRLDRPPTGTACGPRRRRACRWRP